MDNLSHSLVGLAGGELIHRTLPAEDDRGAMRVRRKLLLFSCWFASNFPDIDLVLTALLPEPMGYLLHHRGHTHTFLYALPQALLVFASVWLLAPAARSLLRRSKAARLGMGLSIAAGLVLHLAMDYLNSYGIHPFHPFDSRWFYGDMVFIVEPFLWVAFGTPLIMMVPKRWLRYGMLAALSGVLLYFTANGFMLWSSFAALMLLAAALLGFQRYMQRENRAGLLAAFACGLIFIGVQATASRHAREALAGIQKERFPSAHMLDAALTPFPSNPVCWTFVSIERDEAAGIFRLHSGLLSLLPQVLPVASCPPALLATPITKVMAGNAVFLDRYEGDLKRLRKLTHQDCHFQAWMRFARAPRIEAGQASDMRFSFRGSDNFTTLSFADFADVTCASHVPRWDFPRQDLLQSSPKR